jgi:hypothetical protein
MSKFEVTKLVPGNRYRIEMDDCCIQAIVTGVFERYELDEDQEPDVAVFDFGTVEPMWGQWEAFDVE